LLQAFGGNSCGVWSRMTPYWPAAGMVTIMPPQSW
jgi:hypothetical protein